MALKLPPELQYETTPTGVTAPAPTSSLQAAATSVLTDIAPSEDEAGSPFSVLPWYTPPPKPRPLYNYAGPSEADYVEPQLSYTPPTPTPTFTPPWISELPQFGNFLKDVYATVTNPLAGVIDPYHIQETPGPISKFFAGIPAYDPNIPPFLATEPAEVITPLLKAFAGTAKGAALVRASEAFNRVSASIPRFAESEAGFFRTPWGRFSYDKIDKVKQLIDQIEEADDYLRNQVVDKMRSAEETHPGAPGPINDIVSNVHLMMEQKNGAINALKALATGEQGAIELLSRFFPQVSESTIDAARRVISNLPDFGLPSMTGEIQGRVYGALNATGSPEERLLAAGRALSESLPASGRPALYGGDEYSLIRQAARREGLPAVKVGDRVISTLQEAFHGTARPFDRITPMGGRPAFISDSPWYAGNFMDVVQGSRGDLPKVEPNPRVIHAFINPKAHIISPDDLPPELQERVLGVGADEYERTLLRWMTDNDIDAVRFGPKETAIANPDALLYDEFTVPLEQKAPSLLNNLLTEEHGSLHIKNITNAASDARAALADRIGGIRSVATKLGQDEVRQIANTSNQLGGIVAKASAAYSRTIDEVMQVATRIGVTEATYPQFQEDVEKFLFAQTAANYRRLHPTAPSRAFGPFATDLDATNWHRTFISQTNSMDIIEAARKVADNYKRYRNLLYRTGRYDKKTLTYLENEYPWYNPIDYPDLVNAKFDAAGTGGGMIRRGGAVRGQAIRSLAGGAPQAQAASPLEAMLLHNNSAERFYASNEFAKTAYSVASKDPIIKAAMRKLKQGDVPIEGTEGAIEFWEGGKLQRYALPKWFGDEVTHMLNRPSDSALLESFGKLGRLWRGLTIEQNPGFIAANFVFDHVMAYFTSGSIPGSALGKMVNYLKRGALDKELYRAFQSGGADQSKFFMLATPSDKLKATQALMLEAQRASGLAPTDYLLSQVKRMITEGLPSLGRATEQGQRTLVFEKAMDRLLPNWRGMDVFDVGHSPEALQATTEALEAIINYHRGGYWLREMDKIIPFANVTMQGSLLLPRTLMENPRARWRLAGMLTTFAGLAIYNNTYPENADVPPYIKHGHLYVMLPNSLLPEDQRYDLSGRKQANYVVISPLREFSWLTAPINVMLEKFIADSPTAGYQVAQQLLINSPLGVGLGYHQELLTAMVANYNLFQGRPVVPESETELPQVAQFGLSTSPTAVILGRLLNRSPRVMEAIIKTAAPGPGRMALDTGDWVIDTMFPEKRNAEVDAVIKDIQKLPPEQRESALTLLPTDLRAKAERESLLERKATFPLIGGVVRRFYPEVGGALEEVLPRSVDARRSDMAEALGVDTLSTLRMFSPPGDIRDLNRAVPVMNDTVAYEGHTTRLNDEQLADAHEWFKAKLRRELVEMLDDPDFISLREINWTKAKKIIDDYLEKTEKDIKFSVLTREQKDALKLPY